MDCYCDGERLPRKQAQVPADDLVVTRGYGAFDFVRTYGGNPFLLDQHLDRFFSSVASLQIPLSASKRDLKDIIATGLNKNADQAAEYFIKIIATGGRREGQRLRDPHLLVLFGKARQLHPKRAYEQGVKVGLLEAKRQSPEVKSTNYLLGTKEMIARNQEVADLLYVDKDNRIYEGVRSTFFAVADETVITPAEEVLKGVTRSFVIDLLKQEKIPVKETALSVNDLDQRDEAFITSTTKEILPVVEIEEKTVANGSVGDITTKLMRLFAKRTDSA